MSTETTDLASRLGYVDFPSAGKNCKPRQRTWKKPRQTSLKRSAPNHLTVTISKEWMDVLSAGGQKTIGIAVRPKSREVLLYPGCMFTRWRSHVIRRNEDGSSHFTKVVDLDALAFAFPPDAVKTFPSKIYTFEYKAKHCVALVFDQNGQPAFSETNQPASRTFEESADEVNVSDVNDAAFTEQTVTQDVADQTIDQLGR